MINSATKLEPDWVYEGAHTMSTAIAADHFKALDTERPDSITNTHIGEFTVRTQRHGNLYSVCTMTREGMRVGDFLTTTDKGLAFDYHTKLEAKALDAIGWTDEEA